MKKLFLALCLPALCLSAPAYAHFDLTTPPPTSAGTDGGKGAPPCGDNPTPGVATPAQGGHPLMVTLRETVYHPGFYRFALTLGSLSNLPLDNVVRDANGNVLSPTGTPAGTSATAEFQTTPVFPVLADHQFDHPTTTYPLVNMPQTFTGSIPLPNVTCASCTLQIIEFMAQHGPNPGGAYFYHHCANLNITADPNLPPFTAPGAGGAGAGGASGSPGSGGTAPTGGTGGVATNGGAAQAGSGVGGSATSGGTSSAATGGTAGTRPTGSAGQTGTGGTASGAAGAPSGTGGTGNTAAPTSGKSSGCSVSFSGNSKPTGAVAALLVSLLVLARRRRHAREGA